ncbi:DNA repair helicase XPB2 [Hordeum vulgare]|nr:DNA repair helicase XPB2 [Hordeum vulgare]
MGNPEREVETTRTIKGAFSGATKLGGDPRVKAKMRLSSRAWSRSWRWEQEAEGSAGVFEGVLCGDPRVKAKMCLSSRARSRSWRWEQEAEGSADVFEGVLCDPATGTEVSSWRPGSIEADPRIGMRRRYGGLRRAFSKMRGLVVAGDEQGGEITCVHQGFRFDEDSNGVGNFKALLFSEKEGVGKEIQNKHVTDPNTENNIIEASLSYLIHVVVLFFLKESPADGPTKKGKHQDRMAGGKEEYNAFFYSLVSTDTQEMYYSTKRQQFLIDQGYSFKVITSLPPPEEGPNLSFHTLDEQLDLLGKVLSVGDDMIGVEHLEEDSDGKALLKARRTAGLMSAFSGAGGMVYMVYKCCLSLLPFHFRLYAGIQL